MKKREFTEEEKIQIKAELDAGVAKSVIAKRYNTSYVTFKKRLIEWGFPLGKLTVYGGRKRQYNVNDSYFHTIDSEDKAYWLGFLYADGYITEGNKI